MLYNVVFLFVFFLKLAYFFGCAGSSLLCRLFSSCGDEQPLSSCGAWASHCGGFSCGAQALGRVGFSSASHVFSSCGSFMVLEHRLNSCGTQA